MTPGTGEGIDAAEVLRLRDQLRELFALIGVTAAIESGTVGLRSRIVVTPLSPVDAQRLVQALDEGKLRAKVREANRQTAFNAELKGGVRR